MTVAKPAWQKFPESAAMCSNILVEVAEQRVSVLEHRIDEREVVVGASPQDFPPCRIDFQNFLQSCFPNLMVRLLLPENRRPESRETEPPSSNAGIELLQLDFAERLEHDLIAHEAFGGITTRERGIEQACIGLHRTGSGHGTGTFGLQPPNGAIEHACVERFLPCLSGEETAARLENPHSSLA